MIMSSSTQSRELRQDQYDLLVFVKLGPNSPSSISNSVSAQLYLMIPILLVTHRWENVAEFALSSGNDKIA